MEINSVFQAIPSLPWFLMYGLLYQLVALKSRDAYVGLLAEIGSPVFYGLTVYLLDMWNIYVFYFISDEDNF